MATVASLSLCGAAQGNEDKGISPIGRKAENFTLNDFYGKPHSLDDYKDKSIIVLAFLGTECPLAKLYGPRLAELQAQLSDKGVQFLAIDSNRQDSITEIAAYARIHEIKFPILKDLNNKLADELGATRTPEVFVLDRQRVVRYHGRVDDQYGVGFAKKAASEPFLRTAVEQLLSGAALTKPETELAGCFIGRVRKTDSATTVTFSNQVVRILNKNCVACHRTGEIAPFTMSSYEEVSGWADTIAEVVRQQRMPPWHADPKFGHFSNDRSLSIEDKEILYRWAKAGAPEGDKADLPEPPKFVDGWKLPKDPDAEFAMAKEPYRVPAEGTVNYQYFTVDPGFTENKWLQAVEARPGNHAVVHHIIVFASPKGAGRQEARRQFLVGFAPGASPLILPTGMAKFIPAGSELVFQVHYTPNGAAGDDISKVGMVFADPKQVTHVVQTVSAASNGFAIPPGADDYQVDADSFRLDTDVELVSFFPHMHLRGKSFRYQLTRPDGKTEILLDVPRYDFGWQTTYELASYRPLPKGTTLHCTAHFDNSEHNLNNPDPKATVRWGDQTWEEMMIGFFDISAPVSAADVEQGKVPDFSPGADQVANSLFDRLDKNHDGKLSADEIPSEPAQAKLFFTMMDKNQDGELTMDEVKAAIRERQRGGGGARGILNGIGGGRREGGRRGNRANGATDKPSEEKPADKPEADKKD